MPIFALFKALFFAIINVAREYFAFAHMVRGADNAFSFHLVNNTRVAIIADLKIPLNKTCLRFALTENQRNGFVI